MASSTTRKPCSRNEATCSSVATGYVIQSSRSAWWASPSSNADTDGISRPLESQDRGTPVILCRCGRPTPPDQGGEQGAHAPGAAPRRQPPLPPQRVRG